MEGTSLTAIVVALAIVAVVCVAQVLARVFEWVDTSMVPS